MADDTLFAINLVTPERILVSGPASEVILRTAEGDVTFLAGHAPLVGTVEPGVLRVVRAGGEVERVAVHGGFVQVEKDIPFDDVPGAPDVASGTRVTLLIGVAELAEEIDVERARVALEAAEARVAELGGAAGRSSAPATGEADEPHAELVEAEAELLRAQVRIEAADASAGVTAATG